MKGHFSLARELLQSPLWTADRFSKGQALVDLIGLANWGPGSTVKRGVTITLNAAELAVSERELSQRWQWTRTTVRRFLGALQEEGIITLRRSNLVTILKIQGNHKSVPQNGPPKYTTMTPIKGTTEKASKPSSQAAQQEELNMKGTAMTPHDGTGQVYHKKARLGVPPLKDKDEGTKMKVQKKRVQKKMTLDPFGLIPEEQVWQLYPRKIKKQLGLKAIRNALAEDSLELLLQKTQLYASAWAGASEDDRIFIPYPATFFNQRLYREPEIIAIRRRKHHDRRGSSITTEGRATEFSTTL